MTKTKKVRRQDKSSLFRRPSSNGGDLDMVRVSEIRPVGKTPLAQWKPKSGTRYAVVYEQLAMLGPDQELVVPTPKGIAPIIWHNRLNAVIHRAAKMGGIVPPKGYRFIKRTTAHGDVVIRCVPKKK